MFSSLLLLAAARAAAPTIAPTDGVLITAPARPAWVVDARTVPPPPSLAPLQAELDQAWRDRAGLDPESARRRIRSVVAALVPTLTVEQRDLLQRALFLDGVLDLDTTGGVGAKTPASWTRAIAVSPGAGAPASADTSFAIQAYDAARTSFVAAGGPRFDPGSAELDVRVDGLPVRSELALLPGLHTVSLHVAGADPLVLLVRAGPGADGVPVEELQARLDALAAYVRDGARPPDTQRAALHAWTTSPMLLVSTEEGSRELWLVDGAARWGRPHLAAGLEAGATGLMGGWADTPAGCDGLDHAQKLLVPGGVSIAAGLGSWRLRLGGGVLLDAGDDAGFALTEPTSCGGADVAGASRWMPWGWASVGRRVRVGGRSELEPALRVGFSSTLLHLEGALRVPLTGPGLVHVELAPHAGLALNTWSGAGNRQAFVAGLDTTLLLGAR